MFGRRRRRTKPRPPCPECGGPLVVDGTYCRRCGYDASVEAQGEGYLDGIDLPEDLDDEAYDDLLAEEGLAPPRGRRLLWTLAAILALIGFVMAHVL